MASMEEMVQALENLESPEELKDFLGLMIETQKEVEEKRDQLGPYAPGIPFIFGKPGMGKTSVVEEFCRDNGYELVEVNCAQDVEERFRGLPYPLEKKKRTKDEAPVEIIWVSSEVQKRVREAYEKAQKEGQKGVILFLDDVHYASESLSSLLQELLTRKSIAGKPLPPNTFIVLAGNYGDESFGQDIAAPIMSRIVPIRYEPPARKMVESYEKWAKEFLGKAGDFVSLTALEFLKEYPEILEDKEERNKIYGTTRSVSYFITAVRMAERKLESGEYTPHQFQNIITKLTNMLPEEYREKFLRYYFTVRDIGLVEFIEKGDDIDPGAVIKRVEEKLINKGLNPNNEPVNIYVRGSLSTYFSTMLDEYTDELKEAVNQNASAEKILDIMGKYREKLSRVGKFYNALAKSDIVEKSKLAKSVTAGIWDALTVTAFGDIRRKIELARDIYTFADDHHPDKKMIVKLWNVLERGKALSNSRFKDLSEAYSLLDAMKEFDTVPTHLSGVVLYVPFVDFLYFEPLIRRGEETTIASAVGSELITSLTLESAKERDRKRKDPKKFEENRKKFNRMRL